MRAGTACALALLLVGPAPALARDSLPWKDANPVERTGERPKARHPHRRAETPKAPDAASPPITATGAVPVPEARPDAPSTAPSDAAAPPPPGSDAAKPAPRPNDAPKPETSGSSQPGAQTPPAEPAAASDPPLTNIPVPDERPVPTPAEAPPQQQAAPLPSTVDEVPAPTTPEPPAPAKPDPAKPEDAPNSTEKLKSREPDVTPAATVEAAAAVEDSMTCEAELKKRGAKFTVEETISEGECGVLRPVALRRLSSGVEVTPKTQMLCRTALALDDWMTKSVVPAAKVDLPGETLTEFRHASTYVCRPRASENGISEHARGSAIDIGGFVFKSGREIGIAAKTAGTPDETFLETVRAGACGPFKTVLGPGTDADHATHFHLDIAARRNGATYCK